MRSLLSAILLSMLAACGEKSPVLRPWQEQLVVATRSGPTTHEVDSAGKVSGFEHDLIQLFAQELGVEVQFVLALSHAELTALLRDGRAHIAAAAMAPVADDSIRFSRPIRELKSVLVQNEDAVPIDHADDLAGRTVSALAGSQELAALTRLQPKPAGMRVLAVNGISEIELLEQVSERKTAVAAVNSGHFDISASFFPGLQPAIALPESRFLVWAFPRDGSQDLFDRAEAFIERVKRDGTLARLVDRYFGHAHRLAQNDVETFLERMQVRLPRYRHDFMMAQEVYGIDWRLIAALAYQESHWDPLATSPTNVRGMMMLTEETADRLRVGNRLDARQSILAGARYVAELRDQIASEVKEPDRTWIALAAYNLGMGHMNGARAIAQIVRRDPNSWYEMKQVLPLLARPEFAARLKSGRARGGEAVIMVENIRTYYDILARIEKPHASVPVP